MSGVERKPAAGAVARAGRVEWATVFLLPMGSIIFPILGWLVGVALLWRSRVWTTREKLIGTLLVPGGLSSALILFVVLGTHTGPCSSSGTGQAGTAHCSSAGVTGGVLLPLFILLVAGGIVTPIFLARRATVPRR